MKQINELYNPLIEIIIMIIKNSPEFVNVSGTNNYLYQVLATLNRSIFRRNPNFFAFEKNVSKVFP